MWTPISAVTKTWQLPTVKSSSPSIRTCSDLPYEGVRLQPIDALTVERCLRHEQAQQSISSENPLMASLDRREGGLTSLASPMLIHRQAVFFVEDRSIP